MGDQGTGRVQARLVISFRLEEEPMGQKAHTLLAPGAIRRVQLLDRLMKGRQGAPKLPPREDDAAIRRTAARVRAGVIPGLDPAIPLPKSRRRSRRPSSRKRSYAK